MKKKIKSALTWMRDDWKGIISPGNEALVMSDVIHQCLQRCKLMVVLLLVYEPISLALMLMGYSQTYTVFYVLPTAIIIGITVLMAIYLFYVRIKFKVSEFTDEIVLLAFLFLITSAICVLIIGDITQYGQTFLNYLIVLFVMAIMPILRFRAYAALMGIPFLVQTVGFYVLLDHTLIIEPVVIFICALAVAVLLSHTAVSAINSRYDLQRLNEQLNLSEQSYRLALEQSGKIFSFFDIPDRILHLPTNVAEFLNIPADISTNSETIESIGIFATESIENVKLLLASIISGEPSGEEIIALNTKEEPDKLMWLKVSFVSTFDAGHNPNSSIVIYEDITDQHDKELAYQRIVQLSNEYSTDGRFSMEIDLEKGTVINADYKLADDKMKQAMQSAEDMTEYLVSRIVADDDRQRFSEFLSVPRLMRRFRGGQSTDSIIVSLKDPSDKEKDCMRVTVQMITDPYYHNVKAFFLANNVEEAEKKAIKMQQDIDRLKTDLESSRIKNMINQMQPHFLYNALSAIQTIIKIDPDRAYRLVYDFTVYLRAHIKALSSDTPIPFKEELKNIKAYLNIEQMRMGDDLNIEYQIDCDDFRVIPLTIQPIAENAARHGIWKKIGGTGTVWIKSYETEDNYIVEVDDDGTGFDVDTVLKGSSNSFGLNNLIYRLKLLMNAEVEIESKVEKGTKVKVIIPKSDISNPGDI